MVPRDKNDSASRAPKPDLVRLPRKDPVEFAAFARRHPRAAARAFELLSPEERMRLVARARGNARRDLILLSRDPGALVEALPAVDLLLTLKEIGDDAPDLLQLAPMRQVRLFIDLDAWKGDRIDIDDVEEWMSLLQESGGKLEEAVIGLDREVLVRWLRGRVRVWKVEADGTLPEEAPDKTLTLDGVYHLEALRPKDDLALIRTVLLHARTKDEVIYWQLLEGVIHELDSDLETWAFRWRESRLNDEGFPGFDDALPVYGRLDWQRFDPRKFGKAPAPALAGQEEGLRPAPETLVLRAARRDSLLSRAWEEGRRQGGWEPLEEELAGLLNRVLVADRMDWDSPSDLQALFERAASTLNLGVEIAVTKRPAGDEVAGAAALLREVRLEALFRLGFSRTLDVRDAALRAAPEEADWIVLLEPPLQEAIRGARLSRPLFWSGLTGATEPVLREFRTIPEIETALRAMELAGALRQLWREVSGKAVPGSLGDAGAARGTLNLGALVATLFAWDLLEGDPRLAPLPRSRLAALKAALFTEADPIGAPSLKDGIPAQFQAAFKAWVEGLESHLRPDAEGFLEECLERLRDEIGPLDTRHIDPRAVRALLLC